MSKLYKQYVSLKVKDSSKMYLFKCGIFYIFLDEDARIMSKFLDLKLTNLNSVVVKCAFPVDYSKKYFNLLKNSNYNIEVVYLLEDNYACYNINEFLLFQNYNKIVENFLKVKIDNLSISQAFDLLNNLQKKFKEVKNEQTKQ